MKAKRNSIPATTLLNQAQGHGRDGRYGLMRCTAMAYGLIRDAPKDGRDWELLLLACVEFRTNSMDDQQAVIYAAHEARDVNERKVASKHYSAAQGMWEHGVESEDAFERLKSKGIEWWAQQWRTKQAERKNETAKLAARQRLAALNGSAEGQETKVEATDAAEPYVECDNGQEVDGEDEGESENAEGDVSEPEAAEADLYEFKCTVTPERWAKILEAQPFPTNILLNVEEAEDGEMLASVDWVDGEVDV